jgi:putative transposase
MYAQGGTFFFTLVSNQRMPIFSNIRAIQFYSEANKQININHPFSILAYVILPDHIHCIWKLPDGDTNYSTRWRLIKTFFTREWKIEFPNQQKSIWQNRYWEHLIRDERDLENHFHYIHYNPVKHGLISDPENWLHSSYRYYVEKGYYPGKWDSDNNIWDGYKGIE